MNFSVNMPCMFIVDMCLAGGAGHGTVGLRVS